VCLLPVSRTLGAGPREGAVVTWTTLDLISPDEDSHVGYLRKRQVMSRPPAELLPAPGYLVVPLGNGGAWLMTGRRAVGPEVVG
jgi:hypothetical protein